MRPIAFDKEPAYILHRRPYQETANLVQFLTLNHGRITVLVRQSVKMLGQSLQSFTLSLVTCSHGNELHNLRHLETQGKLLLTHPQSMMLGLYLNELLLRLVPQHIKSVRLFSLYANALHQLSEQASQQEECESILRHFEITLLEIIGYGLELQHDAQTDQVLQPDAMYYYEPGVGPAPYMAAEHGDLPACRGSTLLALGGHSEQVFADCDAQAFQEARAMMRTVISYYLRGKNVNTRSIFRFLQEY